MRRCRLFNQDLQSDMLVPVPLPHGTGRWDATECLAARLGRAWVGRLRVGILGGHSPDRSQWVPTGSVIAAVRNGELAEQLARVGLQAKTPKPKVKP